MKIAPGELSSVLSGIVSEEGADLLIGFRSSDDAAAYRIDDKRCLLSTVDFFPPMVRNARTFGRIAAANALSDVYAMGGRPLYALNMVCFPQSLDQSILKDILIGGMEKCAEAGALLAGGHSIYDNEIKYGLAVTGIVDIDRLYRNNTPRIGDKLILTKPLGMGIIIAADRGGEAYASDVAEAALSMERLNKYAAAKLVGFDISACTDVSGYGLIVHTLEMTAGNVAAELSVENIPYFSCVKHYIERDFTTRGGQRNRVFAGTRPETEKLPLWLQELLYDPQTSGGLLIAVDSEQADDLLDAICEEDPRAAIIGRIVERENAEVVFC